MILCVRLQSQQHSPWVSLDHFFFRCSAFIVFTLYCLLLLVTWFLQYIQVSSVLFPRKNLQSSNYIFRRNNWIQSVCYFFGKINELSNLLNQLLSIVTIMCRNHELSSTMSWVDCLIPDAELFILFAENSQILLKISLS